MRRWAVLIGFMLAGEPACGGSGPSEDLRGACYQARHFLQASPGGAVNPAFDGLLADLIDLADDDGVREALERFADDPGELTGLAVTRHIEDVSAACVDAGVPEDDGRDE